MGSALASGGTVLLASGPLWAQSRSPGFHRCEPGLCCPGARADCAAKWLMYWCHHTGAIRAACGGEHLQGDTVTQGSRRPLSVPPLAEQRRIVDLIEAVDLVAEMLRSLVRQSESVYSALLRYAFDERLIEVLRHPLGEVSTSRLGKMLNAAASGGSDQHPYVRNADVQWDRLNLDTLNTMTFTLKEQEEFRLQGRRRIDLRGG